MRLPSTARLWLLRFRRGVAVALERRTYSQPEVEALAAPPRPPAAFAAALADVSISGSRALRRVGMPRRAQQLLERLAFASGGAPDAWRELARTVEAGGPDGLAVDPILGLVRRGVGDPNTVRTALNQIPVDQVRTEDHRLRARSHLADGDPGAAEREWDIATSNPNADASDWFQFGRTRAEVAARNGGFDADDFRVHRDRLAHALRLDPGHRHARYHLCRVAIRASDWRSALTAAAGEADVSVLAREMLDHGHDEPDTSAVSAMIAANTATLSRDVIFTAHWWLLAQGATTEAFLVKRRLAEKLLEGPARDQQSMIDQVTAHIHLGEARDATRLSHRLGMLGLRSDVSEKVRADVYLAFGEPELHTRRRADDSDPLRRLVRGRDVVILGPHAAAAPTDGQVVIRTKWFDNVDERSEATTVSYYPETTAASAAGQLIELLDGGRLEMAVLRPRSITSAPRSLLGHSRVRVCPDEFSMHLEASAFAIQRVVYDVLRHQPSSVTVDGIDFFASSAYPAEYQIDATARADLGIKDSIGGYGHDLLGDFRWSQRLSDAGVVRFGAVPERILKLPEIDYLRRIERNPAGRTTEDRHE